MAKQLEDSMRSVGLSDVDEDSDHMPEDVDLTLEDLCNSFVAKKIHSSPSSSSTLARSTSERHLKNEPVEEPREEGVGHMTYMIIYDICYICISESGLVSQRFPDLGPDQLQCTG